VKKLLLLEDDPVLGKGLKLLFELENFLIFWTQSIAEAKDIVSSEQLDFAILDVGLPDGNGIDFCAYLKKEQYEFPIIMLTAKTDEDSVVKGLMNGANDYVKKPFSNKELIARVNVNLKKVGKDIEISVGELRLNSNTRKVYFEENEIKFNRKEFDILKLFLNSIDAIVTREQIITDILDNIEVIDRTVDSHISHIRSKLKKAGVETISIKSEYGIGYRMVKLC